jgi:hypothetical protein
MAVVAGGVVLGVVGIALEISLGAALVHFIGGLFG